jgi:hypothetical protein
MSRDDEILTDACWALRSIRRYGMQCRRSSGVVVNGAVAQWRLFSGVLRVHCNSFIAPRTFAHYEHSGQSFP